MLLNRAGHVGVRLSGELKFRDNAAIAIDLSWPEKLLARTDVEVLHAVELITYYSCCL